MDPFAKKYSADQQAANRKAAKEIMEKREAERQAKLAPKPQFNDLPQYKFRDVFKWGPR